MNLTHSLLKRQLKQCFGELDEIPEDLQRFMGSVNAAYLEFDNDREMLERSLELSSQELLKANSEMRGVLAAFPDLFIWVDQDGWILDCKGGGGSKDYCISMKALIGKRVQDIPGKSVSIKFVEVLQKLKSSKETTNLEYSITIDGTEQYYEARALPILNQFLIIIRNITDRKIVERKIDEQHLFLKKIIDLNPNLIFATDKQGQFTLVNRSVGELFGQPVEKIIGKVDVDFNINEAIVERFRNDDREVIELKTEKLINEEQVTTKDGRTFWFQTIKCPIFDDKGDVDQVLSVATDITERKKTEGELNKSQKLESVGQLAGGIAHNFNNLLTVILGNVSLATNYLSPDSESFELLTNAENAIHSAKSLTQQLLTFAKGGAPIRKVTPTAELIKETTDFTLSGSKIRCKLNISEDVSPVNVDPGQISQVIQNLIINADQAMENGGSITIEGQNVKEIPMGDGKRNHGEYVKIVVSDMGTGISKENLSKIFDPFFTTKNEGQGLGLATVYSIIKNHAGYVDVSSKENAGTKFIIYLPVACQSSGESIVKLKTRPKTSVNAKINVLIMDDDPFVLKIARKTLEALGYVVKTAKDGADVISSYKKLMNSAESIDVVILDLTIQGGMGGIEANDELKKIDPNVKAVVSSGYSGDLIMSNYNDYGFSGVLSKPYNMAEMNMTIQGLVRAN